MQCLKTAGSTKTSGGFTAENDEMAGRNRRDTAISSIWPREGATECRGASKKGVGIAFVGSDAVSAGLLTRGQLRHRYRPIFRGIYVPRDHHVTLRDRLDAATLVAPQGVIAGVAASALHGAKWVDATVPIELVGRCRRQAGLIVRNESLSRGDVVSVAGIDVTSPARTAFDLARHLVRDHAVARMDALMNSRPFAVEDVARLAEVHRGARGLVRLRKALPLVDAGAESPKETWLRLLFVDANLPTPATQFTVRTESGQHVRRIDMVWERFRVGAEYDGAQHLTDRYQYRKDVWAQRELQRMGWNVIHVIKEDRGADIVDHVRKTLRTRGWRGETDEMAARKAPQPPFRRSRPTPQRGASA